MVHDELVEKVARAIYEAEGGTAWDRLYEGTKDDYRAIARAALSVARQAISEECAAVVKTKHYEYLEKWKSAPLPNGYLEGMVDGADEIENAIRAMEK